MSLLPGHGTNKRGNQRLVHLHNTHTGSLRCPPHTCSLLVGLR
jgi:hypothetical protein